METIELAGHTVHKWNIGASTFLAWPETGARLMNWHLTMADGSVRDVIHWPEDADMANPAKIRGGNPILFPFAGRTYHKGSEDTWGWQGTRRPMPRHGFARDAHFEITEADDNGFAATLLPTEQTRACYPFDYVFTVRYRFRELAFAVELELENTGDEPIPWSAGHHFYFQLPWNPGASRAEYRLELPAKKAFYHAADGHLEPVRDFSTAEALNSPALLDRIHTHLKQSVLKFGPLNTEEDVTIKIGSAPVPDKNLAVVTWTENEESPFYCVEPWMGPPNSPEHKKGLHTVEPGQMRSFGVEVSLF